MLDKTLMTRNALPMLCAALLWTQTSAASPADNASPQVRMQTSEGAIVVELDRARAPQTVDNFLSYVREGFYEGTIFHRVIKDFMVQGGGFTPTYQRKTTHAPIRNEADNGLKNLRGTIAMARTSDPHSATAQFFINTVDNAFLDHREPTRRGWGYTVFGRVVDGMGTVDRIEDIPTGSGGPLRRDVPERTVVIEEVSVVPLSREGQRPSE